MHRDWESVVRIPPVGRAGQYVDDNTTELSCFISICFMLFAFIIVFLFASSRKL